MEYATEHNKEKILEYTKKQLLSTENLQDYLALLYLFYNLEQRNLEKDILTKEGKKFSEEVINGKRFIELKDLEIFARALKYGREELIEQLNKVLENDIERKINEYPKIYGEIAKYSIVYDILCEFTSKILARISKLPPQEKLKHLLNLEVRWWYAEENWISTLEFLDGKIDEKEYDNKPFETYEKFQEFLVEISKFF